MSDYQGLHENRPVVVIHHSSCDGECRYCHRPIALYGEVGWVDRTPPYYGGSYDMCDRSTSGQHEPSAGEEPPVRARIHI